VACRAGEAAELLLKAKANVNAARVNDVITPLHAAVQDSLPQMVDFLLRNKATGSLTAKEEWRSSERPSASSLQPLASSESRVELRQPATPSHCQCNPQSVQQRREIVGDRLSVCLLLSAAGKTASSWCTAPTERTTSPTWACPETLPLLPLQRSSPPRRLGLRLRRQRAFFISRQLPEP